MKQVIILGDVELGGGTLTDDFISDKALIDLIDKCNDKKKEVDLVFNGDTFDFLKCPYVNENGKISYPRHITTKISLAKLKLIYKEHKEVFEAWKRFVDCKKHKLYFIYGNHDHDLFFKLVQEEIGRILNVKHDNVFFSLKYNEHRIHAEHGHQYDYLNKINPRRAFLKYKGDHILNISWVSLGIISKFMTMKEEHPFLERVKPLPMLFSHHKMAVKKVSLRSLEYFFKSVFYYPIKYYYDPTYRFPKALFREFYRRLKNKHWEVDKIVDKFKRRNRKKLGINKIYVLSHIHERYIEEKEGWVMIHPDTWRDEYILQEHNKELVPKVKSYVHIVVKGEELEWNLVNHSVSRRILRFDDVKVDEHRFIDIVKREERIFMDNSKSP